MHLLLLPLFCSIIVRDVTAVCQSKYNSKSLHQVNVLETVLFLFTVTLFTLNVNHTLSEYLCKKSYEFYSSLDNNYITKKCHFPRMMFLSNFLFFFDKKITLESRNTIFPLISVAHQIRAALY